MKTLLKKALLAVWIGLATFQDLGAQSILTNYIEEGLKNNQQLIREQLATQLQAEVAREARGKYLPDVFFDASYTLAGGGRTINVPAGDLINPTNQGLNQLLGENRLPTNVPNTSEQLLPDNFHETKVRLIQPVLNSSIYYNYKAQVAQSSAQQAKKEAFENQLVKEIKVAYYTHLSAREGLEILMDTKVLLAEQLRVSEKLVANQKATKEVIYASRAEVSEIDSKIAEANRLVHVSRIQFNFLLNRDLEEPVLAEQVEIDSDQATNTLTDLNQQALSNRKELAQLNYGLEASRSLVLLNKSYVVPEINLVTDLGYQGFDYTFDNNQDFWLVRIGLTWPIFQGFQNKSKVQQSVLREKQLQSDLTDLKKRITLEVSQAFYAYQEASEILSSRKSELVSARENFRITARKYEQNQALLVEYNEARTAYTTAQLNESIAKYNLKINEASLEAAINLK